MKTPEAVSGALQDYLQKRWDQLVPTGERTRHGHRFTWCGEVLEFLTEGVTEYLASLGLECLWPYPGPFRLWDEDQHQDGEHVRRFWAVVVEHETRHPVAKLCTVFYHRHDRVAVPRPPRVVGFPPDYRGDEAER